MPLLLTRGKIGALGVNREGVELPPAGQGFELNAPAKHFGLELLFLEIFIS